MMRTLSECEADAYLGDLRNQERALAASERATEFEDDDASEDAYWWSG